MLHGDGKLVTLPNFLIIGAPKCGTTSVYNYLGQHPDVFVADKKEPRFFAYEGGVPAFSGPGNEGNSVVTDLATYQALFARVTTERAVGEGSTMYLYWPQAAQGIQRYVPHAKLIAILRDPVERAYSNFLHQRRYRREPLSDFTLAMRAEPKRIANNWGPFSHYAALGRYHAQLERYHGIFGRKSVRVYLYDELKADPLALLQDIFRFLNIDDEFVPDVSRRHNVIRQPRMPAVRDFIRRPSGLKDALRPFVPDALRRSLIEHEARWNCIDPVVNSRVHRILIEEFRDDISKLATLLDKDLSHWLNPKPKPHG